MRDLLSRTVIEMYLLDENVVDSRWMKGESMPYDSSYNERYYGGIAVVVRPYDIAYRDLDKRARVIEELYKTPKSNKVYVTKMAERLERMCREAGREDLVKLITDIVTEYTKKDNIIVQESPENPQNKEPV